LKEQGQRALGVKRDVCVAWAGIPPVQALEPRGLGEGRKQDDAFVREEMSHLRDGAVEKGRVLHHFKTGDVVIIGGLGIVVDGGEDELDGDGVFGGLLGEGSKEV
jgi:hypothetical protein